jgi:hypothetical protein
MTRWDSPGTGQVTQVKWPGAGGAVRVRVGCRASGGAQRFRAISGGEGSVRSSSAQQQQWKRCMQGRAIIRMDSVKWGYRFKLGFCV